MQEPQQACKRVSGPAAIFPPEHAGRAGTGSTTGDVLTQV